MYETTKSAAKNRLRFEKSPYLLQHAENPVDWYPWGQEAFDAARREDKPIFLSTGYSTCHWCHVMGRESFENPEAARVLNESFISIKVDREERPDVDAIYMAACQALSGSGGWPLSILMTPDQEPFWAGTYLPVRGRGGQLGLVELLEEVARLWRGTERRQLLDLGSQVARHIARRDESHPASPDRALLRAATGQLSRIFDRQNGGFGGAPKFPQPHDLLFLMAYARREEDQTAWEMAVTTLNQMARGGIFDQIGGGFCRYSTDAGWQVPHFEKMLYDNALLAYAYLEAFARTGRHYYREIACRTLDYALRELRLPGGGFACGQDADSSGEEGRRYLLSRAEVCGVLGKDAGERFCNWYHIPSQGERVPNLLFEPQYDLAWTYFSPYCGQLEAYRRRWPLHRDDKVVTSWNAMMIAALAKAYQVLGEAKYLQAAASARLFLKTRLTAPDGRLYLRWRDREAAVDGQLDDYAFYCWALLELYQANFSVSCLKEAAELADKMRELFWDGGWGGFFHTPAGGERLIARQKDSCDSAIPSGNAVAALALARLGRLTGEPRFRALAERQLDWLAGEAKESPAARCFSLLAMMEELYPTRELVCVSSGETPQWLAGVCEEYGIAALAKTPDNSRALERIAPVTAAYPLPEDGVQMYLCQEGRCAAAVDSLAELRRLLAENRQPV